MASRGSLLLATNNGKQVLAVTNFPPKQIGCFLSECLITGVRTEKGAVTLVKPEAHVDNGERLF